jgi:XTP/dITP diphosphohydrolase
MKIYLVTKNRHKLEEISKVMDEFNVAVEQIADEKFESKEMDLEEVAHYNSGFFYNKYKKPVVVDDTGIFFKAYPGFPGNHPRLIFSLLGYKGLLKLLEGEAKDIEFRTVVGYCDGKNHLSFQGSLNCVADTKVNDPDKDVLAYERITLLGGKPLSQFSIEEKNKISHRAEAFRKLGRWLRENERLP